MSPKKTLRLERLEDRRTPATWGNPWPDADHLTLSFAADGTTVGDQTSSLFAAMDAIAPRAVWQREALRAFQTWAVNANINIAVVGDGGQAFGSMGSPQGDERFGDIRLAAYHTGGPELALASPFDPMAGTWSGDVKIDLNSGYGVGAGSKVDLYSALLHEAGHVFGLNHSSDQNSPLFEDYLGMRTVLSGGDISRLQAIYGARRPDAYEGIDGNETRNDPTPLSMTQNSDGSFTAIVSGDVSTNQDLDVYSFTTGVLAGSAYVRLSTAGESLLTARVSVLNSSGQTVATTAATDPASGDLILTVNGLNWFSQYYVRVESAAGDVFGVGSYQLKVQKFPLLNVLPNSVLNILNQVADPLIAHTPIADPHNNENAATATPLAQQSGQVDGRFDANYRGVISNAQDHDFYRIVAPANATTLTAMAWATPGEDHLTPRVSVFDSTGTPLAANVLAIDSATSVVQVAGVTPGTNYYVMVQAGAQADAGMMGNYFLGVDFSLQASTLDTYTNTMLTAATPVAAYDVEVSRTSLFHFVLSVDSPTGQDAKAWFVIRSEENQLVYYMQTNSTEAISGRVVLRPGRYVVGLVGRPPANSSLSALNVHLRGAVIDDPIGPQPIDTTESPSGDPPPEDTDPTITWTGRESSNDWDQGADEPWAMA